MHCVAGEGAGVEGERVDRGGGKARRRFKGIPLIFFLSITLNKRVLQLSAGYSLSQGHIQLVFPSAYET